MAAKIYADPVNRKVILAPDGYVPAGSLVLLGDNVHGTPQDTKSEGNHVLANHIWELANAKGKFPDEGVETWPVVEAEVEEEEGEPEGG